MKRSILLIDGGYLKHLLRDAKISPTPNIIEVFSKHCFEEEKEDCIRILYYDCPPYEGKPPAPISKKPYIFKKDSRWLDDLARRDFFAVRLGVLKFRGWELRRTDQNKEKGDLTDDDFKPRFEQKGVDMRIGLDISSISHKKNIDRIILVSGDTDCIPAVKLARKATIQVVLIRFEEARLSNELIQHVDMVRRIDIDHLKNNSAEKEKK